MTNARPLTTDAERDAFRAYMHDLDRQAAIAMGDDPDAICSQCGHVTGDDPDEDARHAALPTTH